MAAALCLNDRQATEAQLQKEVQEMRVKCLQVRAVPRVSALRACARVCVRQMKVLQADARNEELAAAVPQVAVARILVATLSPQATRPLLRQLEALQTTMRSACICCGAIGV